MPGDQQDVLVGRIAGAYGIKGWVRVRSFTDPEDNILSYSPWRLRQGEREISCEVSEGRAQGKGLVVRFAEVADRTAAEALSGMDVLVDRSRLPEAGEGRFYWADLEGLEARDLEGRVLGRVDQVLATGANDVLVIQGDTRLLIPFLYGQTVRSVDLDDGSLVIDWRPED